MKKKYIYITTILIIIVILLGGFLYFEKSSVVKIQTKTTTKNVAKTLNKAQINKKYDDLIAKIKTSLQNSQSAPQAPGGGFERIQNVSFNADNKIVNGKYGDGNNNTYDLFTHAKTTKPLIISIHGGGFMIGSKEMEYPHLQKLYDKGYNVMTINYTLSNEGKFPQPIYDVKEAVKYVKANYKKLNLENTKIILMGESAGANLASISALSANNKDLENPNSKYPNISDRVNAIISLYAPVNFSNVKSEFEQIGLQPKMGTPEDLNSPENKYLGVNITSSEPLVKKANPETYLSKNMPPIYIQAGYKDNMVGVLQNVNYARNIELAGYGDKLTTKYFETASHGGSEFETNENIDSFDNWISKNVK